MIIPKHLSKQIAFCIKNKEWPQKNIIAVLNKMELFVREDTESRFCSREELLLYFGIGEKDWFAYLKQQPFFNNKMQNQIGLIDLYCSINTKKKEETA